MADLADHEQVVLPEQIVGIVNAPSLRVFHWHQAIFDLARCHGPEDISECAIGDRLRACLRAKIDLYSLIPKGAEFSLEGYSHRFRLPLPCFRGKMKRTDSLLVCLLFFLLVG